MTKSNYLENAILNLVFRDISFSPEPVFVSLHTADPGETGAAEVAGGSYARQSVAAAGWNAAASGLIDNINAIDFTGMPATTVTHVGIWDAVTVGNFLYGSPLGTTIRAFALDNTTTDDFLSVAHGFVDTDEVVFEDEYAGSLPSPVVAGTIYFVISAGITADSFRVSATSGGASLAITTKGNGIVRRDDVQPVNAGNTFRFAAGALDIREF